MRRSTNANNWMMYIKIGLMIKFRLVLIAILRLGNLNVARNQKKQWIPPNYWKLNRTPFQIKTDTPRTEPVVNELKPTLPYSSEKIVMNWWNWFCNPRAIIILKQFLLQNVTFMKQRYKSIAKIIFVKEFLSTILKRPYYTYQLKSSKGLVIVIKGTEPGKTSTIQKWFRC